ncbi:DUF2806 domain-containing protein [Pelagibacterium nitratireducens]|uniref:DUF2806 domain-containing protein n=1 Tax=Pelagibacterium nitratireducens TaxID=1046114 RepID=A0ABZ2HW62_9HYPH
MSRDDEGSGQSNLPEPVARQEERKSGWLASINPQNAARVVRTIGKLTGIASRVSDGLSQKLRENKGRDTITAAVAERLAAGIKNSDPTMERIFQREAERLVREQENLEEIADIAAENLGGRKESDFQKGDIEDDWLYQFENAAKGFSSDRMKHTFARILSGEILRPGSYSPATLKALVTLSSEDAKLIAIFMSMAFTTTVGSLTPQLISADLVPGSNGLRPFGLSYDKLSLLQQCGFLSPELNTHREVGEALFTLVPGFIGSSFVRWQPLAEPNNGRQIKLPGLLLTKVGSEISQVVERGAPPPEYIEKIKEFSEKKMKLKLLHT